MKMAFLLLPAMIVALAGCQTGQQAVNKDPKAAYDRCIANVATWNITAKHEAMAFMGVSEARLPAVFCRRLVDALASGRLTLSDINRLQTNQPTNVWRVLKGK